MKIQIFTFSPVQRFIEKSRRLSDLFYSSYLLSYLTERVMERVESLGGDVIYPVKTATAEDLANYPNRVVFSHGECICEELLRSFEEVWREIWEKVLTNLLGNNSQALEQAKLHLENYFRAYCECAEEKEGEELKKLLGKEGDSYAFTYTWLEMKLGSKKSQKPYKPIVDDFKHDGKYPDGCTLCGERAHLALDWESFRKSSKEFTHLIKEGEKLCGVCLVKRFLSEYFTQFKVKFPSTEDVANYAFKKELKRKWEEERTQAFESLRDKLWQYTGKFKELYEYEVDYFIPENVEDEDLKNYLEKLYLEGHLKKPKKRYFCLILSDGDNIGDWLSLESSKRQKPLTEEFHREFSQKLSEYAHRIKRSVPEGISVVYAGGDDVMAVGDLKGSFEFLRFLDREFKNVLGENASVSTGLVIVHAKEDLRYSLELLRTAEKRAKNECGRSAFSVYAVPRGGAVTGFCAKWEHLETFLEIVGLFERDILGDKTVYDLRQMVYWLEKPKQEVILALLRRMLIRRIDEKKLDEDKEKYTNSLLEKLKPLACKPHTISNMFYVARFLAKERREKRDEVSVA